MLLTGLFVEEDNIEGTNRGQLGLFFGGGFYLLGIQLLACVCIMAWSGAITFILLFVSVKPTSVPTVPPKKLGHKATRGGGP